MNCSAIGLLVGLLLFALPAAALEQGKYRIETTEANNGVAGPPSVIEHCFTATEVFDPHRAALMRLSTCNIHKDLNGRIEAACNGESVIINQRDETSRFTDETRRVTKDPTTGKTKVAVTRTVGSRIGDCK